MSTPDANSPIRRRSPTGHALGALLLAGLVVLTFYPGIMTNDSKAVLEQARTLELTDWHPPIMAILWKGLDAIVPGPALMLLAQALLYAGAAAKLCYEAFPALSRRIPAWLLVVLFGAFPPVFALTGMMWKDIWMSSLLLLALAYLFRMASAITGTERWRCFALLVLCCAFATAFRHNALAATAGLLAGGCFHLLLDRVARWPRLLLACCAGVLLSLALALGVGAINRAITTPAHPTTSILLHDIAGTTLRSPAPTDTAKQLLRDYPGLSQSTPSRFLAQLRRSYNPASANGVLPSSKRRDAPFVINVYSADHNAGLVQRAWLSVILEHPTAYLRHRAKAFSCLLRLCDTAEWERHSYVLNSQQVTPEGSNAVAASLRRITLNKRLGWVYAPAFWLLLVVAAGVYGLLKLRQEPVLVFLSLSGLGLAASLFFTSPIESYRYIHWVILLGWIATASMINKYKGRGSSIV